MEAGLVSVIIPTRNSARTIGECLESINNQSYDKIETIVVDALSSDGTVEIAKTMGAHVISLDSERARAKNEGMSQSRGEFLLFIDSDMVLERRVVQECVELCKGDANIAGVTIPERSVGDSFWVKVRDFERSLYAGSKIESARFFRRILAIRVGGFDEDHVFYEESTLHQKIEELGVNVNARISAYILHIEESFDLIRWLGKKKYYFDGAREYSKKYQEYAKLQTSIRYRIALFTSNGKWKKLLRHPILSVGLFILKSLELLSQRL